MKFIGLKQPLTIFALLLCVMGGLFGLAGGARAQAIRVSSKASDIGAQADLQIYNAKQSGLKGDGTTNDTSALQTLINTVASAGGGTIFFPSGTYLISGALQDTSVANCQIKIPYTALNASQVTINFVGASRPPMQYDPGNGVVLPIAGYTIIKSTLTGGTGTAALIGTKSTGTGGQNNVQVNFKNLIFACPNNPTFTCLNLVDAQANEIKDVLIHAGVVNLPNVVQPTNTNAYGVKLPPVSHSPCDKIDGLTVFGFYTGMLDGELTVANGLRMWGCAVGLELPFAYHPSLFTDLGIYWCTRGIKVTGAKYFKVSMLDNEHANNGGATWQNNVYDLDDPGNQAVGDVTYLSVSSSVGVVSGDYVKNGGANVIATQFGSIPVAASTTVGAGWWNNNGAISGAVAAYDAKGASSYVVSKTNLAIAGQHNLTDGASPTWASGTGWTFNGSSHYLVSDLVPPTNQASTLIIKFNAASGSGKWLAGSINTDTTFYYGIQAIDDGSTGSAKVVYLNGSAAGLSRVSPSLTSGSLAIRGTTGNRGGTDEGTALGAGSGIVLPLYVGAVNSGNAANGFAAVTITSMAYYNTTLTASQVSTIMASMP